MPPKKDPKGAAKGGAKAGGKDAKGKDAKGGKAEEKCEFLKSPKTTRRFPLKSSSQSTFAFPDQCNKFNLSTIHSQGAERWKCH